MTELTYVLMINVLAGLSTGLIIGFAGCFFLLQRALVQCALNSLAMSQRMGPQAGTAAGSADKKIKGLSEIHEENKAKKAACG